MGLPDGHYRIKYRNFDDTFDTGGSDIVAGPMSKEEAVQFKEDSAKQHSYHGINCEYDMRVRKDGNWHHMHHATGEATEHRTHIAILNENTYKLPEASSLSKEQEDEETRLIGERMSREAGYDVTRGTGRKEAKSGLMQTSVSATIRNNMATERHEENLRDTAHGIEPGYGKPTDTELTKSHYAAYCEFENGCEETGQNSFEYNKVKTVLNAIGFHGVELYEMLAKVSKAPDVKKYLESGVISTREDLESVLTSANKSISVTKTRQR